MSLQNLANQMQTTGRGGDTMLVHMNPKEVAGLQQLAMAHGGSLTINPETGLPEAGFLSSILPTVLGMALAPATGGASLGLTSAFQTAALVGAGTGLMTGSLKKGLMAGLGAFGSYHNPFILFIAATFLKTNWMNLCFLPPENP
jgi:hypothetical protein